MMEMPSSDAKANVVARIGAQPIALAAIALAVIMIGIGSIALWRAYTGTSPEQDRIVSARQLQTRTAQASEQLVEKTKGLEATQQESIDQLQVVQDQLLTVRRLLTAQQTETRKLSEQVGNLTGAIDGLRQSYASTQSSEPASPPSAGKPKARSRPGQGPRGRREKQARQSAGLTTSEWLIALKDGRRFQPWRSA